MSVTSALTSRAPWPVPIIAVLLAAQALWRESLRRGSSMDNLFVVRAVRYLLDGVSPYTSERFLYPPSSIPFALIQAPVGDSTIRVLSPWVCGLLLLIGWFAVLRMFDTSLFSWLGVAGVAAFPAFIPGTHLVALGSWTAIVACLTGVAFLLMSRDRWGWAGAVIGLSIAIKPMLMPIGLIFLLARRWRGFALAAGLPVLACAVVLPLLPDPGLFFTKTLPFLLGGQDDFARLYDGALPAMLPRAGIDNSLVITGVRAAVLALAIAVAVLRWRRGDDERLRIVESSAALMVGTFLVMSPSFDHYAMVVVPAMLASIVLPGSLARSLWFWIAMLPWARWIYWPGVDFADGGAAAHRQSVKTLAWTLLLLATLTAAAWFRRDSQIDPAARRPPPDRTSARAQSTPTAEDSTTTVSAASEGPTPAARALTPPNRQP